MRFLCYAVVLGFIAHADASELYSQLDALGNHGSVSSFCSTSGADVQATDDFTVPTGETWTIRAVGFRGGHVDCRTKMYGPWPANVFVYEDASGLPGNIVASRMNQPCGRNPTTGYVVNIDVPIILAEGTYWISYQRDVDNDPCNVGVRTRAAQTGSPYAWQHGGEMGQNGCLTWGVGMTCNSIYYDPDLNPDLAFALFDTPLQIAAQVPTLSNRLIIVFALLLVSAALLLGRRRRSVGVLKN